MRDVQAGRYLADRFVVYGVLFSLSVQLLVPVEYTQHPKRVPSAGPIVAVLKRKVNLARVRVVPPLNALRAFEAGSRHASFTHAAQELYVSQGAISRHVAALEDWLKVQLFSRHARGIELTPKGALFFQVVHGALDQIEYGARQLREKHDQKTLRLKGRSD